MAATLTIGGVQYVMIEDKFDLTNTVDERQRFQCDVQDYTNSHFTKGATVVVTDPVLGVLFNGVLNTDKEVPNYPSGYIVHSIDCIDYGQYAAGKRTYTRVYSTAAQAGKIAVDQLHDVLSAEGVNANYAEHFDTTASDFNTGILTNVTGTSNVGDGNLDMATQGVPVVYRESTQADFAAGTLTNTVATPQGLTQTNSAAIRMIGTSGSTGGRVVFRIWSGSQVIASNDSFTYEIWISSTSPTGECAVDFTCTDGTTLGSQNAVANFDAQGIAPSSINDISGLATNNWYTRTIPISGLSGKTISSVTCNISATKQGIYTVYFRNIYLGSASGSPFFLTNFQQNPPLQILLGNFSIASISVVTGYGVATTGIPPTYVRYSPSTGIDAVNLLRSSVLNWTSTLLNGASVSFRASYDGGITFLPCTINTNLPGLMAGQSVAGKSFILEETLVGGIDPTTPPVLATTTTNVQSAAIATTRNDLTRTFSSTADWNSGILTNLVVQTCPWPLATSMITLNGFTRTFLDGNVTNVTSWGSSDHYVGPLNQALAVRPFASTTGAANSTDAKGQLNFVGNWQNFTSAVDLVEFTAQDYSEAGFVYRTTFWGNANNTFAYTATMTINDTPSNGFILAKGSNSSSGGSTRLATPSNPVSGGSTHRLKIVINGNNHQLYMDDVQYINFNDSSFTATGGVGLRCYNGTGTGTFTRARFANFGITSSTTGTWVSPSVSLVSVGTYGTSAIAWRTDITSTDATVLVETSINGGSTYQAVTNGGSISGLTAGQSLSGVSLLVRITLSTQELIAFPAISGLRISVSNQYVTLPASRSTAPMGNDMSITRTVGSGWGTAFDSQTWTQVGTGTTAVASGEETIANTTGDVHMVLGSRTWPDEEGTVRFSLSNSSMIGGMELRYIDSSHYYRLTITTTTINIIKNVGGGNVTLATASVSLSTGTFYRMRFRVAGVAPVNLYAKVWSDGSLEPGVTNGIMSTINPMWNITATD